jgi:FkbM family methyltransferase
MKRLLKQGLRSLGYDLRKIEPVDDTGLTMFAALKRCMGRGIDVGTVIDVGASDGSWTRECIRLLPDSEYLLIEAQKPHKESLDALVREFGSVQFTMAAAAGHEGKVFFDDSDLYGGLASDDSFEGNCIEVNAIRIDDEVSRRGLNGPFLIKLDTHGYEVPIIEGAPKTLAKTELLIIEAYNYRVAKDSLFFHELCRYMGELGFRPIEIADLMLRRHDRSLWQMDIFFVREDRPEFKCDSYF